MLDFPRTLVAALGIALVLGHAIAVIADGKNPSAASIPGLEKLAKQHAIQIVTAAPAFPVKTTYGPIDGKGAGTKELGEYAPILIEELGLYPPQLVKRANLRRVVLCTGLSFASQVRSAVPDYEHATLYLDVVSRSGDDSFLRKVIHHEFYHLVDYIDDGSVYEDKAWSALNAPGHKYGAGGKHERENPKAAELTEEKPGFLNLYSTAGVEEDKAEIFANLVVDHRYVERRAEKDDVIRAKVARMKETLGRFCPPMDTKWWQARAKARRADVAR